MLGALTIPNINLPMGMGMAGGKKDSGQSSGDDQKESSNSILKQIATNTATTNDVNGDMVPEDGASVSDAVDTKLEQPEVQTDDTTKRQIADSYVSVQEALETPVEEAVDKSIDIEKKDQESLEESNQRLTAEEFDALDDNDDWKTAKTRWKQDNPQETLKEYKDFYLQGKIDELPWEKYLPEGVDLKKKRSYIMKEKGQQIRKESEE